MGNENTEKSCSLMGRPSEHFSVHICADGTRIYKTKEEVFSESPDEEVVIACPKCLFIDSRDVFALAKHMHDCHKMNVDAKWIAQNCVWIMKREGGVWRKWKRLKLKV